MPKSSASTTRLRQSTVKEGFKKLKLTAIRAELEATRWSASAVAELIDHLRRADGLIVRHPDPGRIKRRDKFLREIEDLVASQRPDLLDDLERTIAQLGIAEDGYRRILAATDKTEWKRLPPPQRVAAVLARAAENVGQAITIGKAQAAEAGVLNLGTPTLRDGEGRPIDADAPIDAAVSGLGATLMMEAYGNGWFQDDVLILPSLPPSSEGDRYKAGSALFLAANWERWERIEEQARYLGPDIETCGPEALPDTVELPDALVYRYSPRPDQWNNLAASWRTQDRARQNFISNGGLVKGRVPPWQGGRPAALAPAAFVAENEVHGFLMLCERLGRNIADYRRAVSGLRVTEWLRGYAALSAFAEDRFGKAGGDFATFSRKEILEALGPVGLAGAKGETFVDRVTFQKNSRDLFDTPLIKTEAGSYLVFRPTVVSNSPAVVVLSLLATDGVSFDGFSFEERVRTLFKENDVPVAGFKFGRGGDTFEYDAVAVWGQYVFVFECKNRSIPGTRGSPAYFFELEIAKNVHQLKRQRQGLIDNPDELEKRFGAGTSSKTIVLVSLRNQSYSRTGEFDGVHFYDYSALSRFFEDAELSAKKGPIEGPFVHAAHTRIWQGDRPSADDLKKELDDPVQLRLSRHHTRVMTMIVGLDLDTVALSEAFLREQITTSSLEVFAGLPAGELDKRLDAKLAAQKLGLPPR